MKAFEKFFIKFHELMTFLAKLLIVGMTVISSVQVFTRYVLGKSIRWSEEVPLIMMVWFGFISMAIGVRNRLHLSIQVVYQMFPRKYQSIIYKFSVLCVLGFGLVMVFAGYNLSMRTMSSTLPATKLPSGYLYAVIPFSGLMITYDSIVELIKNEGFEESLKGEVE